MLVFPVQLIVEISNFLQKKSYEEVYQVLLIMNNKYNQKNNNDVILLTSQEGDLIASVLSAYPYHQVFGLFDQIKANVKVQNDDIDNVDKPNNISNEN